ncbi:class I adenylate-forming enzyme family protein [Nocardioides speluncae]|uniref:class I adenylate-forming enzyme family protein n=1 Tax=Nocardioides speluncae TaxID=2670337 RepID=UPI000D6914E7|nr:class I adenylate-forming enzyme family protein [Nocardioides speluncae]
MSSAETHASDVAALLTLAAEAEPDRVALAETGGRELTWRELDEEVRRVATGLRAAGVIAGYRVLIAVGNRVEFVTTYLGTQRARVVAVPVNPGSSVSELARMIADSGSRMVVADADTVTRVREAVDLVGAALAGVETELAAELLKRAVVPRVVVAGATLKPGERSYDHLIAGLGAPEPVRVDPEALAVLLYTSGTSGRPRAAMLSHRALLANIEQVAAVEPHMIGRDDTVLGVLPLFHVYGLNAVLGSVLRHRAKLMLAERFDPQGTLDLVGAEGCTVLPVAPPVFGYWLPEPDLRDRLAGVRLVLSGSAPLAGEVVEEFATRTGIAVHQGYGLTEAAPAVTSTLCSKAPISGSVGAALPGVEIRLAGDSGDSGGEAHDEDPGEIELRGPNLFSGYWPDGGGGPGADGWWSTGDVGYRNGDGDLFLVDRLKELVIVSGFNVYPIEVEDVIREVPGVVDAAVIGVSDPSTGEAVVAYVTADRDAAEVEEEVRRHCEARLARFKQPSAVNVVAELPLTVTGKVQKGRLRAVERRRVLGLLDADPDDR